MSPYLAGSRAQEAADELVADPSTPYYAQTLEYLDVRKGRNRVGERAWVGVFAAPQGKRVCIAAWIDPADIVHWLWDYRSCNARRRSGSSSSG